jgi:hypothetical protein
LYSGSSATISFTGTAGATVSYTIAGGSPVTITLDGSGAGSISVAPSTTTTYALVSVTSVAGCSQSVSGSAVVTVVQAFTKGNLVVERPNGSTNAATAVILDQYDTTGTLINSYTMPGTGASQISISGTATSEGLLNMAAEKDRLVIVGYDVAVGTTGSVTGIAANRVIGSVASSGQFTRNFARSVYGSNNIRSGTAFDTAYIASGSTTGIILMNGPLTISSTATNTRAAQVLNGQLYYSTGSGVAGIYKVGTGVPVTSGTTATVICRTGTSSPYSYSMSPDGLTLFVADDATSGVGLGIRRYTRASASDTFATSSAVVIMSRACMGVAVDYSATPYTIYATTHGSGSGATAVDSIVKLRNVASSAITLLAVSPTGQPFRGIQFAPAVYGNVSVAGAATICSGDSTTVAIQGNPYGRVKYHINSGAIQTATLDYTGSATASTGALVAAPGFDSTYTVYLDSITVPSGTKAISGNTVITVHPHPVISVITTSSDTLCTGASLTLSATTVTVAGGSLTYAWSGPASFTSTAASPVVTVSTGGTYSLTVTDVTTSCVSTPVASALTVVNALPDAGTISATPTTLCVGGVITLTDTAATGSGTVVSYNWSGPGGYSATGTSATATFTTTSTANSGIYSVTVTYTGAGCTSLPVTTSSVSVNAAPAAYSLTGGGVYCGSTPIAIGLSNSDTGMMYQLYNAGAPTGSPVAGTGTAIPFGTFTATGTYTVQASGAGGCAATMSDSVSIVDSTVNITPGANPSVCMPRSSIALTYSGATGYPATYDITWSSAAHTAGFSDVSAAGLGGSIALALPSGIVGSYSGTLTVSNGSCTSVNHTVAVNAYAHLNASIVSAAAPCSGYATSIVFSGTSGATIGYKVDGGSLAYATLTGGTYSLSTGAISGTHTYTLYNVSNPLCDTVIDTTVTINPIQMQWTGTSDTDWNNVANWSCGFVPGATDDVLIPVTSNNPVIAISGTVRAISIATGANVTVKSAAYLNVKGAVALNGSIIGSGRIRLNGAAAQTISGTGSVNNFELDNSAGAALDTASRLTIKSVLYVTSGTLATGDSVVLYSDAAATARVAPIPTSGAAITGNVKVMQYVPGGLRRFRFWSHPFSTYIGLEQAVNYIDITGTGGTSNGFTYTASGSPSAFRYDPYTANSSVGYDPGWKPFTSAYTTADSNRIHRYQGIRLFMRGAKGEGLGYTPYTPSAVTIAQWGPLNQGAQTVTLSKGTGANQDYNMIGNPYAAPVDIGTVIYNARAAGNVVGAAFYVWNPNLGAAGQYQALTFGGSVIPYYIQANSSFQVRAAHDGDSLNFAESNKSDTASASLLRAMPEYATLGIYDGNYHQWDMLHLRFTNDATDNEDIMADAVKPSGAEFNFYSLSADNRKLVVDARPYAAEKVIPLGISGNYAGDFIIRADNIVVPEGGKLYLHDKLLHQYTLLQAGAEYKFSITADKATQGNQRFELSMAPAELAARKGLQVNMTPNPASDDVTISFSSATREKVSVRMMDLSGVSVYTKDLGALQSGTVKVPVSTLASGIYMVELTSGEEKVVQRLIKD